VREMMFKGYSLLEDEEEDDDDLAGLEMHADE
jgi:hypothetical protein